MVTGAHIHFTASHIQGSAGPLGTNAGHWHDVFLRYGAHSDRLQGFIATLVCHLTNNVVPWDDIYALMSCQLVALGKCPGVRPIGIGKTLRITCKTVRFLTRGRAPLVVKDSNEFLYSNKGVTQGDPLSMFIYAVATVSLIHHISHPNTGRDVCACGLFQSYGVNVTTSHRLLGSVIGNKIGSLNNVKDCVSQWVKILERLIVIAETQPQYSAYTRSTQSQWTYLQRELFGPVKLLSRSCYQLFLVVRSPIVSVLSFSSNKDQWPQYTLATTADKN
uniref:Uncharacterized protein n=1 Tax=Amphimedon queenslandica TaxID=400682 RepID=A0A1X7UL50_AMPQE